MGLLRGLTCSSNQISLKKFYKTGVLMLNMGGCDNLAGIENYLTNIFTDKDIINIPFSNIMGPLLAKRRTPTVTDYYRQIGGKSPIKKISEDQAQIISDYLDIISPNSAPHKTYVGFRYSAPLIDDAIASIMEDNIERCVAVSQYPQYSCTTTGSSLNRLVDVCLKHGSNIQWSMIDRWSSEKFLINFLVNKIGEAINRFESKDRPIIIFTAHSVPMNVVERGDPYISEVFATVAHVMEKLNYDIPYRVSWQSRIGPIRWMVPTVDEVLKKFAQRGHKNVILAPVVFTCDCSETLYELDILYQKLGKQIGLKKIIRIDVPNLDVDFLNGMSKMIATHIKSSKVVRDGWMMRCPGCTNRRCIKTRTFFGKQSINVSKNEEYDLNKIDVSN